ncbi:Glycoside hydrolase, family 79 [Sesbania bispinosa]|nr:Glycoside hydrolase, family 79 [Sesbania bispinosa]
MNHSPQRTTWKRCTSLQQVRDGVVVRAQAILYHIGKHVKSTVELSIKKENFDDCVAYANCGVLNAFKDSACIAEDAEDVKVTVKGVTTIAKTDENFICATLDWWPSNKCDYDQCPWAQAGILNLDLSNKILSNAIMAFDHSLRIRLGGSLQDQIIYHFGKQKECPSITKKDDGLFGFSQGCLSKERWDEVNDFVNKTGVKLTFGLNALIGKKNSEEDKLNWVGDWNPKNAIGNELCAEGIGARVDSVQYAKDITRLRYVVNRLYPDASTRPKVLGPGGFYGKEWFASFLQNVGPGVVDGVTHHIYNLGAGVDPELINKVQDPYFLSQIAQTFKDVAEAVKEFTPWAGAWVGESGGAYNSGGKDVSHTFANGFWSV